MKLYRSAAAAALLGLSSFAANAALVTVDGTDVRFTYDDSTLYGSAMVVGNAIMFNPTNFRVDSLNGAGAVNLNQVLNITVEVITQGFQIDNTVLVEAGDYFLSGGGTSVSGSGQLNVTSATKTCGLFACSDSDTFNITGLNTVGSTAAWSGGTSINLADTVGWGADTEINVQVQNNLSATSLANGEEAWIAKKQGAVGFEVSVIPIPAAVWLFGSALGGLAFLRRRS